MIPKPRSLLTQIYPNGRMGRYGVGMIMKHRQYHYYCVIYAWDLSCRASQVMLFYHFPPCFNSHETYMLEAIRSSTIETPPKLSGGKKINDTISFYV